MRQRRVAWFGVSGGANHAVGGALLAGLALTCGPAPAVAQGTVIPGVGPVNASMAGTSVAAPLDPAGAMYWNPATIAFLGRHSFDFGLTALLLDTGLTSSIEAGALGPSFPATRLAGSDDGDNGVFALPSAAFTAASAGSRLTYGFAFAANGGFGVNYRASPTNPILTPQPPHGFGFGAIFSRLQIAQLSPTLAYRVTDELSIGLAPNVTAAELRLSPAPFATPDDANGDGFPSYPSAHQTRIEWGAGFQLGVYWQGHRGWQLGAAFKSPQWFKQIRYPAVDELGRVRADTTFDLTYPMMLSAGVAYSGIEHWLFAADTRFIAFESADGFGGEGFDAAGRVTGLGWSDTLVISAAAQFAPDERWSLRIGVASLGEPITDEVTAFNLGSPGVMSPYLSFGASWTILDRLRLDIGYFRIFRQSIEGPFLTPAGSIPGTRLETNASVDSFLVGFSAEL